ncbi:MAG TPA: transglycosylase SLT domain-containing protein [Candidatus Acidoferrales bacterium]|nr:transglycosylase SLT domain-containing protein [Candidatus Acidoferrales bacterium]
MLASATAAAVAHTRTRTIRHAASRRPVHAAAPPAKRAPLTEQELEKLSRALKQKNPGGDYSRLSAFANQKSAGVLGQRAALALGYYDYTRSHFPEAERWLGRAKGDPLLHDYAEYWDAETLLALHRDADALAAFTQFREKYPDSVLTDQALESLAVAAEATNQPGQAIAALNAYPLTPEKPDLLFLRGEALEHAGKPIDAASDYLAVYLRFPSSERAREAGQRLSFLRSSLGEKIPPLSLNQRISHAVALFGAKDWEDSRNEYTKLLPELSGAERERAELRILECGVGLGAGPSDILSLNVTDPEVEAERQYSLADIYRAQKADASLEAAVEAAVSRAPSSRWAELSLFLAGNYFWVQLDRDRASSYYRRLEENFPTSPNAVPAQWRVAWTEVLKRSPNAAELLADHIRRFPTSPFISDALYWLGVLAEQANNSGLARTYFEKLTERFPQSYFATAAANHLHSLGEGPTISAEVLDAIPPPPPALPMASAIPSAAAARQARADALRSIAFDASAELELRAAYALTGEPRLLFEAAQEAVNAGHVGAAIVTIRQLYPQLESRPFDTVPDDVWRVAYALPYGDSIRHWSAKAGLDPMLVAGLIRQESAFDPQAHSNRDAYGLMQLLPKTARLMARAAHVRYSRAKLFDPDYNIHLGTIYLAGLRSSFGSMEAALAAYNAGEDRVTFWTAGQSYRSLPEFTDSIPFTETREYVEIISRNAEIYRRLYGDSDEPRNSAGSSAR